MEDIASMSTRLPGTLPRERVFMGRLRGGKGGGKVRLQIKCDFKELHKLL